MYCVMIYENVSSRHASGLPVVYVFWHCFAKLYVQVLTLLLLVGSWLLQKWGLSGCQEMVLLLLFILFVFKLRMGDIYNETFFFVFCFFLWFFQIEYYAHLFFHFLANEYFINYLYS